MCINFNTVIHQCEYCVECVDIANTGMIYCMWPM